MLLKKIVVLRRFARCRYSGEAELTELDEYGLGCKRDVQRCSHNGSATDIASEPPVMPFQACGSSLHWH
jgi:hypothetical protein